MERNCLAKGTGICGACSRDGMKERQRKSPGNLFRGPPHVLVCTLNCTCAWQTLKGIIKLLVGEGEQKFQR